MAKKENCSTCHDRGFIEYEHGLICEHCPENCAASIALKKRMFPEVPDSGEPGSSEPDDADQRDNLGSTDTGSDKRPAGSDKGEAAGDRQSKGKKAKKKVRSRVKPILPPTGKKSTISRPPRVP